MFLGEIFLIPLYIWFLEKSVKNKYASIGRVAYWAGYGNNAQNMSYLDKIWMVWNQYLNDSTGFVDFKNWFTNCFFKRDFVCNHWVDSNKSLSLYGH